MFQEYEDAGEFTVKEKLKRSIKTNLMIYGVYCKNISTKTIPKSS